MSIWLRATSPTTVVVGPFVGAGATANTAIEVSSATIVDLYKNTTKSDITTTSAGANTMAHVANGYYTLQLTSGDTSIVGALVVTGTVTDMLPVWHTYQVVSPGIYDALIPGSATLDASFAAGAQASSLLAMGVSVASSLVRITASNVSEASALVWVASAHAQILVASASAMTNLAYQSTLTTVDTVVDSIKVETASSLVWIASTRTQVLVASASAMANLAYQSTLTTVDTVVDSIKVETASSLVWIASSHAQVLVASASAMTNLAYGSSLTAVKVDTASSLVWVASAHAQILVASASAMTNLAYGSAVAAIDATAIASAVWDEAIAGHVTSGTTAEALNAAGGAGDPWITALPGSYTAGQAGNILATVGTNMTSSLVWIASAHAQVLVASASAMTNLAYQSTLTTVDTVVNSIKVETASSLVWIAFTRTAVSVASVSAMTNLAYGSSVTAVKVDTASSLTRIPAALVGGRMDASVGAMANDVITTAAMTTTYVSEIAGGVWDEVLLASTHNVASSAGRKLRNIDANDITDGIVVSALSNSIQLAAGESSVDNFYDPAIILIDSGTGVGQSRRIIQYDGTTKVATVNREWRTLPVAGSTYIIFADGGFLSLNDGAVVAAGATTVTLNGVAESVNDTYVGAAIGIVAGTGKGQVRVIESYNGSTKVATVHSAWATQPDPGDAYVIVPNGRAIVAGLVDGVITTTSLSATLDLTTTQKASVNAQVVDALATDTYAEPGQGAPAATEDLATKIGYVYKFMRNKIETTSALTTVYNDDGTTAGQKAVIGDNGTTFTRGEFGTGA